MLTTFTPGESVSLTDWKAEITRLHPTARFTLETGAGETYGEEGDWTAHTGPDMQADVVGVWCPYGDYVSVWDPVDTADVWEGCPLIEGEG